MTQLHLSDRLAALGTAAALLVLPTSAFAETGGSGGTSGSGGTGGTGSSNSGSIHATIFSIGGESQDTLGGEIWINLDACNNDLVIEIDVDDVPSELNALDFYVGSSCNTSDKRDGEGDDCVFIATETIDGRSKDIRIQLRANELIQKALKQVGCGSTRADKELWVLAVESTGTSDAVAAANYGRLDLNIDTDAPNAPTRITGGRGENEIPVSWYVGSEEVDSFEVYVDSGEGGFDLRDASAGDSGVGDQDGGADSGIGIGEPGATATECGTGALTEGASADSVASFLAKTEGSSTATSTKLSRSHIEGESAAVAVVAVDEAGNRSTLSEVQCVFVVPTTGFKDLYEQQNGDIPQGCPCASTGPVHIEGALPIGVALSILAYRRRRRS